jgi:hypothetical protein
MTGHGYVSTVQVALERQKKMLLEAPLARPTAFGTPPFGLPNTICCGLFKYDCMLHFAVAANQNLS